MKKKILSILTLVLTLIVAVPLFSACKESDKKEKYSISFIKYETTSEYTDQNYQTAVVQVSDLSNSKSFDASDFKVVINGEHLSGSSFITGSKYESYDDFDVNTATHSQTIIANRFNTTTITIVFGIENVEQIESLYYKNKKLN